MRRFGEMIGLSAKALLLLSLSLLFMLSASAAERTAVTGVPAGAGDPNQPDSLSEPVYYEPLGDEHFAFYFDEAYYLSDKFCPFTTIERVSRFDFTKGHFEGDFRDYNNSGQLILTGFYENGKKSGTFRAFHVNGQVKWEGEFMDNLPKGEWRYFYPDGRPMLLLRYGGDSTMQIMHYWDQRGRERVKDGSGRYEMRIEIEGYSEYGAVFVNRRGRIRAGLPTGEWTLEWVYENGEKDVLGTERYRSGDPHPDERLDQILRGETRHALVPLTWFMQAEEMEGRSCSIDHHTGFIDYLTRHIEDWFEGYMDEEIVPQELVFLISVNKDGKVSELVPEVTFQRNRSAQLLSQALRAVEFWFPSYLDGGYIDDELTLRFRIFPDRENEKLLFFGVDISRERGF